MKETRLHKIASKTNHDIGNHFITGQMEKLTEIEEQLKDSGYVEKYHRIARVYSKKPLEEMEGKVVVLSTHIDTHPFIHHPFCDTAPDLASYVSGYKKRYSEGVMEEDYEKVNLSYLQKVEEESGPLYVLTGDNALTNHVAVELLLSGDLPENVIVAFTGNEEEDGKSGCRGAKGVAQMLSAFYPKLSPSYITLDVTDVCHIKNWDATVECLYDHKKLAKKIRERMQDSPYRIKYSKDGCTRDETDAYADFSPAVSICIPVEGEMHSDLGLFVVKKSLENYQAFLLEVCKSLLLKKQKAFPEPVKGKEFF